MKISNVLIAAAAIATLATGPLFAADLVDDATLTSKVKTALIANPVTKAHQIDVESKAGTVQLNGFVDSEANRSEATKVAKAVEGVAKVENNLEVRGNARSAGVTVDDAAITSKVKTALLADSATKGTSINVETREGVVQLNGFAESDHEKQSAEKLAASVDGVRIVHNNLTVKK